MRGRSRAGSTPAKALRAPRRLRRRMPRRRKRRRRRAGRLRPRRSRGRARRAVPSRVTRRPVSRRERRSRSVVPRPNPTSPATRGASVKNGFTPTGSRVRGDKEPERPRRRSQHGRRRCRTGPRSRRSAPPVAGAASSASAAGSLPACRPLPGGSRGSPRRERGARDRSSVRGAGVLGGLRAGWVRGGAADGRAGGLQPAFGRADAGDARRVRVKRPVEPREYHAPPGSRRPRPAEKPIPVPPLPPGGIEAFFSTSASR
jgi:hypothetical protein